jgi:hypothetical protein
MHVDHIELVLLVPMIGDISLGDPNSAAIAAHEDCFLIGAISLLSQRKCDLLGGDLAIQHGTRSEPCCFVDVIRFFGSDRSRLRLINANST